MLPDLAQSWQASNDNMAYVFTLRAGLTWSDGTPLTADHVRQSILCSLAPDMGAGYAYLLYNIRNAETYNSGQVSDPNQVGITVSDSGLPAEPQGTYELELQYSDLERGLVVEDSLALYYWDGTEWVKEPSSNVDGDENVLNASPSHFSLWAVLGETYTTYLPAVGHSEDTTAPVVVATNPAHGAAGVSRDLRSVSLTFDEPVQYSWSLSSSGGFPLSNQTEVDHDSATYTFTFTRDTTNPLPAGARLEFIVNQDGDGFADANGNPAPTTTFGFTTAD